MGKRIPANITCGSAELAILSLLAEQPLYGFEISKQIEHRTEGALRFELASLYPMLYDLEKRGLIKGRWQPSRTGRDRRLLRPHTRRQKGAWPAATGVALNFFRHLTGSPE